MLKIYLIEKNNNSEILNILENKKHIVMENKIKLADVIIVNKVKNIKNALDKIDYALMQGKEIICFKNSFSKEGYVANYLIRDGASYI